MNDRDEILRDVQLMIYREDCKTYGQVESAFIRTGQADRLDDVRALHSEINRMCSAYDRMKSRDVEREMTKTHDPELRQAMSLRMSQMKKKEQRRDMFR